MAVRDDLPKARAAFRGGAASLAAFMAARLPGTTSFGATWIARDWRDDPLFGGAIAYPRSGAALEGGVVREGPVVLSGGDLSSLPGWLEGALEAAEDAAEIAAS
jgi:monoamine oxidase